MQVKIARVCHCVIKNDIQEVYTCKDKTEAKKYAQEVLQLLQDNNCKSHHFFLRESEVEIIIDSKFNVDDIFL